MNFHDAISGDSNHRYRSWEHCFSCFQHHRSKKFSKDAAALNLAFYLASWGMYRASSPLFWKDYKIHLPAVKILLKPKYSKLWNPRFADPRMEDNTVNLIVDLSKELKENYTEIITNVNGTPRIYEPSPNLVTKLLLGTMGCTPACDRYFIRGFRESGLQYSEFSGRFLHQVLNFYRENCDEFHQAQQEILIESHIRYPVMKLVDMYFWKTGSG